MEIILNTDNFIRLLFQIIIITVFCTAGYFLKYKTENKSKKAKDGCNDWIVIVL